MSTPTDNNQPENIQTLLNPYKNTPRDQCIRINVDVDSADLHQIKSTSPTFGTIQTIIGRYVKSIVNELRKRGITYYSPENTAKFIELIVRRTPLEFTGEISRQDDVGRTAGVREAIVNPPNIPANPPREASQGQRSDKQSTKGKGNKPANTYR